MTLITKGNHPHNLPKRMQEKQFGIYRVSYELMAKFLNLDDEHIIVDAFSSHRERKNNLVGIKVEGPLMPKVYEGSETPWVPLDHIQHMKEEIAIYLAKEAE